MTTTVTTTATPVRFATQDGGENLARADLYGLFAELFYAPPTAERLASIADARADDGTWLGDAWNALADAARTTSAEAARDDYERLFLGVGRPNVYLYGSYYLSGFLMEKPLVTLRADLHVLGLERSGGVVESEDHIAPLCEVMRYLIAHDEPDAPPVTQEEQHRFFAAHIKPWSERMCDAVDAAEPGPFYGALAALARRFFDIESQAFEMT